MERIEVLNKNRINHMVGVAEYMYVNANKYNLNPNEMYALGYMHDIGRISDTLQHGEYGGQLIGGDMKHFIEAHDLTPEEYIEKYSDNIPAEVKLLWEADMFVDSKGNWVGFNLRLKEVEHQFGPDSEHAKRTEETIEWLRKNVFEKYEEKEAI